jgi:hypothetical protein
MIEQHYGHLVQAEALAARLGAFRGQSPKLLVWILVIAWCLLPPVRVVVTAATNNKKTSPPVTSPAPTPGQTIGLGGATALFMLWMDAIWCAAGVVCGVGMERLIQAAQEWLQMAAESIKKRKTPLQPPDLVIDAE